MVSITGLAHQHVSSVLGPGDLAIDATAGNGHDTLFLAQCVGPSGRVWAFDIQLQALESTGRRLEDQSVRNVDLIHASHAQLLTQIPQEAHGRIGAVMFNLGYLPGSDHQIITLAESTVAAISAAHQLLRPGGVLTMITYRGHPGSDEEIQAVQHWVDALDPETSRISAYPESPVERGPRLLTVWKNTADCPKL